MNLDDNEMKMISCNTLCNTLFIMHDFNVYVRHKNEPIPLPITTR